MEQLHTEHSEVLNNIYEQQSMLFMSVVSLHWNYFAILGVDANKTAMTYVLKGGYLAIWQWFGDIVMILWSEDGVVVVDGIAVHW